MPSWFEQITASTRSPRQWFNIAAQASGTVRIDILGPIGETWEDDGMRAADFVAQLAELPANTRLDLHLSSPGGSATEGVVIYNNLRRFTGHTRVVVDGMAASAASIIAMAGDEIVMSPGSLMMIHNGRGALFGGSAQDFRTMADLLDKTNTSMAEVYARRAGGTVAGWLEAMAREQWYTAAEAVANGLADRVDDDAPAADAAELDAVAAWAANVWSWKHAGRSKAPAPEPVPATETEQWEKMVADHVAASIPTAPPSTDYLTQLGLLVPPRLDYISALAALASSGKEG